MANFDRSGMTQAGINLMGKAVGGATIQFTKLVLGDGIMTGEILDLQGVVSPKQNVDVTRIERNDNQCTVGGELLTSSAKQGFWWREVGLYAMDPDLGEILYNYGYSSKPDWIATSDSTTVEAIIVNMVAIVGTGTNVDVTVDDSIVFATKKQLDITTLEISNLKTHKRDRNEKIKSSEIDTSHEENKIHMIHLGDDVKNALTGNATVDPVIPVGGLTNEKYANESISPEKLNHIAYEEITFYGGIDVTEKLTNEENKPYVRITFKNMGSSIQLWLYNPDGTHRKHLAAPQLDGVYFDLVQNSHLIWDIDENTLKVLPETQKRPKNSINLLTASYGNVDEGYFYRTHLIKNKFSAIQDKIRSTKAGTNDLWVYAQTYTNYYEESTSSLYIKLNEIRLRGYGLNKTSYWDTIKTQLNESTNKNLVYETSPQGYSDCLALEDGDSIGIELGSGKLCIIPWLQWDSSKYLLLVGCEAGKFRTGYLKNEFIQNKLKSTTSQIENSDIKNSYDTWAYDSNDFLYIEESQAQLGSKVYLKFNQLNIRGKIQVGIYYSQVNEQLSQGIIKPTFATSPKGITNCLEINDGISLCLNLSTKKLELVGWLKWDSSKYLLLLGCEAGRVRKGELYNHYLKYNQHKMKDEIAALKLETGDLKNSISGSIIPEYYDTHINAKLKKIKDKELAYGFNGDTFIFITDIHNSVRSKHTVPIIKKVRDYTNACKVLNGGDNINNAAIGNKYGSLVQHYNLFDDFSFLGTDHLYTMANHDENSIHYTMADLIHPSEMYSSAFKYLEEKVIFNSNDEDKRYYYKDNKAQKIRYISLNCIDVPYIEQGGRLKYAGQHTYAFRQKQLSWLANEALNFNEEGWSVVVFTHVPPSPVNGSDNEIKNKEVALNILKAFKNGTSYSSTQTTGDFAQNISVDFSTRQTGDVLMWLAGHVHMDNIKVDTEIPIVTTVCNHPSKWDTAPDRNIGTVTEECLDVICVDKNTRTIDLIRIGAGEDRQFTY